MQMGGASTETFVSARRTKGAALLRSKKSQALACGRGNMGFPALMKQMLRRFGPRGCDARQDVSAAADIGVSSEEETDFEGWAAQRKKKKKG